MTAQETYQFFKEEREKTLGKVTLNELINQPLMDDLIPRLDHFEKVYYKEAIKEYGN